MGVCEYAWGGEGMMCVFAQALWTDARMDRWTYGCMDGRMAGRPDECMDGRMDGWTDGRIDRRMDVRTDPLREMHS